MRVGAFVLGLLAGVQAAAAEPDFSVLRGSAGGYSTRPPYGSTYMPGYPVAHRWAGFYFGGQVGYSSASLNFDRGTSGLVAQILRTTTLENEFQVSQWQTMTGQHTSGANFGAFAGYNWQFESLILGTELNYNRTTVKSSSGGSITRIVTTSDNIEHTVTVNGTASAKVTDFGSLRLRAGYVMDAFLPYVAVGFAVGRGDATRTALVIDTMRDMTTVPPTDLGTFIEGASEGKKGGLLYGYSVALGLDAELIPNVFVRGEVEYVKFLPYQDVKIGIGSGRVAVGVKY